MRNKLFVIGLVVYMIASSIFLNNMDAKIAERERAWAESVQALQMEQEEVGNEIMMLKDQLKIMGKEVGAQSVLIWDIRERVHLDIGWEIENNWEGY